MHTVKLHRFFFFFTPHCSRLIHTLGQHKFVCLSKTAHLWIKPTSMVYTWVWHHGSNTRKCILLYIQKIKRNTHYWHMADFHVNQEIFSDFMPASLEHTLISVQHSVLSSNNDLEYWPAKHFQVGLKWEVFEINTKHGKFVTVNSNNSTVIVHKHAIWETALVCSVCCRHYVLLPPLFRLVLHQAHASCFSSQTCIISEPHEHKIRTVAIMHTPT